MGRKGRVAVVLECIGLAGAGKTTAAERLRAALRKGGVEPLSRTAAVNLALRRRNDGLLKNFLKIFPPVVWRRFLGPEYALAELTRFCAARPRLLSTLFAAVETHAFDDQDRAIILGSFIDALVEYQLRQEHLSDTESVIVDEGLAQRVFTLFGLSPVRVGEAALDTFIAGLPRPETLVWMDTGPDVCLERVLARPRGPRPWFRTLPRDEQLKLFEEAAARLANITAAFERRGSRIVRLEGRFDTPLRELAARLRG